MLALVTENSRFYYEAVRELNRVGIEFLSLKLDEAIPDNVKVVLTSPSEEASISFPRIVAGGNLRYAVAECLKIFRGIKKVGILVIGVDPGLKPGIAVFADETLVETEQLRSPEEVLGAVQRVMAVYGGSRPILRVGTGGGIYRERILRTLQGGMGGEVKIEVVDETATTPETGEIPSPELKDIVAAVNIAMKNGRSLRERIMVNPKPGEIKQLQKESRKINGSITISKELAEKVALGVLSLEDAVEEHAGRNGHHRERKPAFNR